MKKINVIRTLLIFLLIVQVSCNINSKMKQPEDIGMFSFNLLKDLNKAKKSDYINSFLNMKDVKNSPNGKYMTEEDIKKDYYEFVEESENDYNELKEDAAKNGIKWKEIEYLDFIYNIEKGSSECEGKLYFKFEQITYTVDITAYYIGKEFKLYEITSLRD